MQRQFKGSSRVNYWFYEAYIHFHPPLPTHEHFITQGHNFDVDKFLSYMKYFRWIYFSQKYGCGFMFFFTKIWLWIQVYKKYDFRLKNHSFMISVKYPDMKEKWSHILNLYYMQCPTS